MIYIFTHKTYNTQSSRTITYPPINYQYPNHTNIYTQSPTGHHRADTISRPVKPARRVFPDRWWCVHDQLQIAHAHTFTHISNIARTNNQFAQPRPHERRARKTNITPDHVPMLTPYYTSFVHREHLIYTHTNTHHTFSDTHTQRLVRAAPYICDLADALRVIPSPIDRARQPEHGHKQIAGAEPKNNEDATREPPKH